ncbi:MAG: CBS domain-containing protein [Deltaproteobacteria bacterium]|nr:CBS domain-containing protein [Deltaproteobacteria bacterium]
MNVAGLMSSPVRACRADETLHSAAERMWQGDIGVLPVVDPGGRLVGVVTDRDIAMTAYLRGQPLDACSVGEVMTHEVASCHAETSVEDAQEVMRTLQIRRLPVVDDAGRPVGMLSLNDLALAAARPDNGRLGLRREAVLATLAAVSLHRRPPADEPAA